MIHWEKANFTQFVLNSKFAAHHICSFLFVLRASALTTFNKEKFKAFADKIVHAFLLDIEENPELQDYSNYIIFKDIQELIENIKMKSTNLILESSSQNRQ